MSCDCENNSCNTSSSSCTTDSNGNVECPDYSNLNLLNLPSTSTTDNTSCTCKDGCMSENINECDKLICSFKSSKTFNKICTAKSIYQAIHSDISDFIFELGCIQEYVGQQDLSDQNIFDCMIDWYNNLVMILYVKINNHLSISCDVNGIGKKIIDKIKRTADESNVGEFIIENEISTLKYQNVCERQITIENCEDKLKHRVPNKYYGKGDTYLIQESKPVASYDNMLLEFNETDYGSLTEVNNGVDVEIDNTENGEVFTVNRDDLEELITSHNNKNNEFNYLLPKDETNDNVDNVVFGNNNLIIKNSGIAINIGKYGRYEIFSGSFIKIKLLLDNIDSSDNSISVANISENDIINIIEYQQNNMCELLRMIKNNIDLVERYKDKFECDHKNDC